jgi:hypothetical protein
LALADSILFLVRARRRATTGEPEERSQSPASPPHAVLALQRSAGNAAVARLLDRSRFTAAMADAKPGRHHGPEAPPVEEEEGPEPQPSPESEQQATAEAAEDEDFTLPDVELEADPSLWFSDPIYGRLVYDGAAVHGGPAPSPDEWGITRPGRMALRRIGVHRDHRRREWEVYGDLEQDVEWQTHHGAGPGGEPNIDSPISPVITNANYAQVASDLTPDMNNLNGCPPRTQFWAQDLCEDHEEFHAREHVRFGRAAARTASQWLSRRRARSRDDVEDLVARVPGRVRGLIAAAMTYPGREERAYGDGAPAYQARADSVRRRGLRGDYP